MNKRKRTIIVLSILTIIFTIMGGTFAYWNWASSNVEKTNVTFTVASGFSCSADGGGNITSNDKVLAPAACTNTTYAIKRTITVSPTITQPNKTIYLDLWLKVNSIGSGLSNSVNMKYALTTSASNCTTGVVTQGNFWLAEANTKRYLLQDKMYTSTTTETYYLWVWLDAAETNSNTMNQTFNIELGGNCTDEAPNYVYTANIYDENDEENSTVLIGQSIPNAITKFYDPNGQTQAIAVLETAYRAANSGSTATLPFFLRHRIGDGTLWCANGEGNSYCIYQTQAECNSDVSNLNHDDITYSCSENNFTGGVTDSYVGFVVTPTMAANNSGMTAGTYYLKGGDFGKSFLANAKIIYDAFGGINCYGDNNMPATYNPTYNPNPSSIFYCSVAGLSAYAISYGAVRADAGGVGSYCIVGNGGNSRCVFTVGG